MKFLIISIALVVALVSVQTANGKSFGLKSRFNTWKARFGKKNDDNKENEEKR